MTDALRSRLEKLYWGIEALIDPGVVSSQDIYAETVRLRLGPDSRWLDLGCGHSIFPDWISGQKELASRPQLAAGLDPSFESLRQHTSIRKLVTGNSSRLPFRDSSFNLITANMVFEHLADPADSLREIRRVLAPGGLLVFHTPNFWHFPILAASLVPHRFARKLVFYSEGRAEADVFPTFYRINTRQKIEDFAQLTGFEITEFRKVNTSATGDLLLYGPLLPLVLLWRRLLRRASFADLRSNFIVSLRKPS